MVRSTFTLTLGDAQTLTSHAIIAAKSMGLKIVLVIVNQDGRTISSSMMDGAKFTSYSIAEGKAVTSAGHKNFTSKLATKGNRGIENSNGGMFTVFAGGVPIKYVASS